MFEDLRYKFDTLASESPEISQKVWNYIEAKYGTRFKKQD